MKLILTVGVPASGKTTWAEKYCEEHGAVNVNRDDVRQTLFGPFKWGEYKFDKKNENRVTEVCKDRVVRALHNKQTVVVSDMNLQPEYRAQWEAIAKQMGAFFEIKLFHIDYKTAVERDAGREMSVGKGVIEKMMQSYHKNCKDLILAHFKEKLEALWANGGKPCVVSDIDGTVAEMHKGEEGRRSPFEWMRVGEDSPRINVLTNVFLWSENGYHVVFLSGRDGVCFEVTEDWLDVHYSDRFADAEYDLFMRPERDMRPDWVIKLELLVALAEAGYAKPTVMFDDRNQVVETFRGIGLEVFQVQEGNF